jgi:hypothetical protein
MHKATLRNSNDRPTFKKYYRGIKFGYHSESNEELIKMILWAKRQAIFDFNKKMFTDDDMKKFSLIKGEELKPCMICKELTPYIEVCAEARMCSKECYDEFYDQYNKFLKNNNF